MSIVNGQEENKEVVEQQEAKNQVSTHVEAPMGFEDEDAGDLIIPRIKVINALSPERKEKLADEGDIINSLTLEKLQGKVFIPVFKFTNIIKWIPREEGGGIAAISRDGKICVPTDGGAPYACAHLAEFDNTKQGKDAQPTHTKYMNFFGFFAGDPSPIVLSFAKTNYAEGKRLFSLAKVQMQNMFNFGYNLSPKAMKKNGNDWFNIQVAPAGKTSDEDREYAKMLFEAFRNRDVKFDTEDAPDVASSEPSANDDDVSKAEY